MSINEFLNGKKIMADGIEVYVSNRCYFTIQKESNFKMEVVINKGKENERKDIKTVHALNEVLEKYSSFSEIAGSKKYLIETINRIETIEGITIKKDFIERYETIDNSKPIDTLKNLITKIHYGKKINSEYKDIWRNNILSKNEEKFLFAEAIAKIYKFRHNKLFSYNPKELENVYLEYKEKIEKIAVFELEGNRLEIIKSELNKLISIFENTDFISYIELIVAINKASIKIEGINSEPDFNTSEGVSYLLLEDRKIDISKYIKEYGIKKNYKFNTLDDIINYNKSKKLLRKFENEITSDYKELKNTEIIFTNKVLLKEKESEIISNLMTLDLESVGNNFLNIINNQKITVNEFEKFYENNDSENFVTETAYDSIFSSILKSYEKLLDFSKIDIDILEDIIYLKIRDYENELYKNMPEVYSTFYDYTEPFTEYDILEKKISYSEEIPNDKIDILKDELSEEEYEENCEEEYDVFIDHFSAEYNEK